MQMNIKKIRSKAIQSFRRSQIKAKHTFLSRKKDSDKLCIVLAGYKEEIWDIVFERIKHFLPKDYDMCIVSSGKYSKKLDEMCEENKWSYLYTEKNNVSLVQNLAIIHHPKANYIYKIDEDMFICQNFFEGLQDAYKQVTCEGKYKVGFVAPLIPINGYGHVRFLELTDTIKEYKECFGQPRYDGEPSNILITNVARAKFLWEKTGQIDECAKKLAEMPFSYSICPIRFSIGAILFTRGMWCKMNMFQMGIGNGMGLDEEQICGYCMEHSLGIVVAENVLAGHLGYGGIQTKEMLHYYKKNLQQFHIRSEIK